MHSIYVALGSNIDPQENLKKAAIMLKGAFMNLELSSIYQSKAAEVEDQADFLNAVAYIKTDRSPEEVHATLTVIEHCLKKDPPYRFGPRTIDLDLLLYDDLTIDTPTLTVPHPRMHQRRFVLEPLSELSSDPRWQTALAKVQNQECERTTIVLE